MENIFEVTRSNWLISTDPVKLDLQFVHQYLSEESYWAKNIPLATVEKSIRNSYCFGLYQDNQQIGFARLVTDKATFAYLCDVFIASQYRGNGLGKWLIATIHNDPELQGLRRWMLGTRDAHGLYAANGWEPIPENLIHRFMQKLRTDLYPPQ